MLSIILYGRNDSYGYNLHKRAALSLNCMAEVLGAEGDEILFVDYNTPDDYPTFPEAIRDTLTARARKLLRIFRVRPAQHARFRDRTHLQAIEPVARNVALRRSNPANRWILSTNTDMIFVPRTNLSLSDVAARLEDALYHLPRFEIPETLWESLDRFDPAGTIREIGRWGWDLHLNEIVLGSDAILFDAPGNFQLAPRADLFRIDGFDERMLLGWHVDSNLARRLGFVHGPPRPLVDRFFGYHCDHTRQVTPAHRHDRVQNDTERWIDGVSEAAIPEQRETWGLAGETVEEIRLGDDLGRYLRSLRAGIGEAMRAPSEVAYVAENYDKIGYDPRHVMPYLVDALSCYPRATSIGWIGVEPELLARFAAAWRALGFVGDLLIPVEAHWLTAATPGVTRRVGFPELADASDVFVTDFGPRHADHSRGKTWATHAVRLVNLWFRKLVMSERRRLQNAATAPRRFIAVNSVHGEFQELVRAHIGAPLAPIATRLRQGFVLPADNAIRPLLSLLEAGVAGRKEGTAIAALRGTEGHVFYGGSLDLLAGTYRLSVSFARQELPRSFPEAHLMVLEVVTGNHYFAWREISATDLVEGKVALEFAVTEEASFYLLPFRIEFRLFTRGLAEALVTGVMLEPLEAAAGQSPAEPDWLPLMYFGTAGGPPPKRSPWWRPTRPALVTHAPDGMRRATSAGVLARKGEDGCVVFGPYATLQPGRHLLEVDLAPDPGDREGVRIEAGQINLDVFSVGDDEFLAQHALPARALAGETERLEFTVPDRPDGAGNPIRLEFRVWSSGAIGFMVRSVRTRPLALLPIGQARAEPDAVEPMGVAAAS